MDRSTAQSTLAGILDDPSISDAEIIDFLTGLTKRTVTPDEVCGFIDALRARMIHVPDSSDAIDVCGTGGDKKGTFNISTASAIVLAAGGVKVAKHGNRAATSQCGSFDVLEALNIPVDLGPEDAAQTLKDHNFAFLFAQQYHPAYKRIAMVRKQLGFPTVFNLLGPLLNPASVTRQVIGTFSAENAQLMSEVMVRLDYEQAIVMTSEDGLDEASLNSPVHIFEIKDARIEQKTIRAKDYGLESTPEGSLTGGTPKENAQIITATLNPVTQSSPQQRIVAFNAGIGFYIAESTTSIKDGVMKARDLISNGDARDKLWELDGQ